MEPTLVPTKVRLVRGRGEEAEIQYPVIMPSTWFSFLLENHPKVLLGGHQLHEVQRWKTMFHELWEWLHVIEHDNCSLDDDYSGCCRIPIMIHGDEGSGRNKNPIMVISVQPLVGWRGPNHLNMSSKLCYNGLSKS